jgi:hypothetical protein
MEISFSPVCGKEVGSGMSEMIRMAREKGIRKEIEIVR